MSIQNSIQQILSSIPENVTLVAVSKTKPHELLMEAYSAGQRDFGENYVQELEEKYKALPKDIRWHFIGHLQSNKVKNIAPFVHLIHSVDSLKLLKEINKQGEKNNRMISCLLQVYIAREETKFGLDEDECFALLKSDEFALLKNVRICGLMGMASNTGDQHQVAKEFKTIKQVFDQLIKSGLVTDEFKHLSIGMSGDYALAISCGSNMIRVGSHIFGARDYQK